MPWNLFERIISAFKPSQRPQHVSEEPQPWPEGTQWPECSTEQQEGSQEPSPSLQETPGGPQQDERQD